MVAFALGGVLFVAIAIGAYLMASGGDDTADASEWNGTTLPRAPARPDAQLVDTNGQPFDLRAETGGELTVLFFGYTNCPDACPIQMATLTQALGRITTPVRVVFVTTDPERDTPEVLRSWLAGFSEDFTGLTGSQAQIEQMQKDMQVTVAIQEAARENGQYIVGHYTGAFLITPDDKAHLAYGFGTRQEDWTQDIPKAAANQGWARATSGGGPS